MTSQSWAILFAKSGRLQHAENLAQPLSDPRPTILSGKQSTPSIMPSADLRK